MSIESSQILPKTHICDGNYYQHRNRKIATGVEKEADVKFVDFSDMANVRLCLEKTKTADLELELAKDGISVRAADVLFEKTADATQNGKY